MDRKRCWRAAATTRDRRRGPQNRTRLTNKDPARRTTPQLLPDGIDGLIDLVSGPPAFAELTNLVKDGGVALTTNYVADQKTLAQRRIRGGNFMVGSNSNLVERLGSSAASGKLKINIEKRVPPDQAIAAIAEAKTGHARGKTVIVIQD